MLPLSQATDHSIEKCLAFRYGMEALVNMGNIQVEFVPHDKCSSKERNGLDGVPLALEAFVCFSIPCNHRR